MFAATQGRWTDTQPSWWAAVATDSYRKSKCGFARRKTDRPGARQLAKHTPAAMMDFGHQNLVNGARSATLTKISAEERAKKKGANLTRCRGEENRH